MYVFTISFFVINVTYFWLKRNRGIHRGAHRAFINDVTSPTSGFLWAKGIPAHRCLRNKRYRSGVGARRRGGTRLFPSKTITLLKGTAESPPKGRRTHSGPVSKKRSKANRSRVDFTYREWLREIV